MYYVAFGMSLHMPRIKSELHMCANWQVQCIYRDSLISRLREENSDKAGEVRSTQQTPIPYLLKRHIIAAGFKYRVEK